MEKVQHHTSKKGTIYTKVETKNADKVKSKKSPITSMKKDFHKANDRKNNQLKDKIDPFSKQRKT